MRSEQESRQSTKVKQAKDIGEYLVIGFIVGAFIGAATGDIPKWAGLGMCLGILIGAISSMRKKEDE